MEPRVRREIEVFKEVTPRGYELSQKREHRCDSGNDSDTWLLDAVSTQGGRQELEGHLQLGTGLPKALGKGLFETKDEGHLICSPRVKTRGVFKKKGKLNVLKSCRVDQYLGMEERPLDR